MKIHERFGYEWNKYDKLDKNYEIQFWKWIYPLNKSFLKNKKILDAGCFPKRTPILLSNFSQKPIEKIQKGDIIFSHRGNPCKVIKRFKRNFYGRLYTIKMPYSYRLTATYEHPILAIKKQDVIYKKGSPKTCNTNLNNGCSSCKKRKYNHPDFIPINKLASGDFVAIPRKFSVSLKRSLKNEFSSSNKEISLARFLGWYLAEGSLKYSHKPKVCGICFTLSIKEEGFANEIKELAFKFGVTSVSIKRRPSKNIIEVLVYGKKLAELILKLGGRYSNKKRLHTSVFLWDKEAHINLLQAYFLGDGFKQYVFGRGETYKVKSASKTLIHQIRLLFNKYGICPSFFRETGNDSRRSSYHLQLNGNDVAFLSQLTKDTSIKRRYRFSDSFIFIPIEKVVSKKSKLTVYNLEIEKDHSYIANGLCVHNCGMGRNSYFCLKNGAKQVIAFDYDKRTVNAAKKLLKNFKNVKVNYENIYNIPYKDKFDLAICIGVIHHLEFPEKAIEKLIKSLKSKGTLLIWVYGYENNEWIIKYINPIRKITSKLHPSIIHKITYIFSIPLYIYTKLIQQKHQYIKQISKFKFKHLHSIVFDQLLPQIARYYKKEEAKNLLKNLKEVRVYPCNNNSWTVIGQK